MPIDADLREKNRLKQQAWRERHSESIASAKKVMWALTRRVNHRRFPVMDAEKNIEQLHRDIALLGASLQEMLTDEEMHLLIRELRPGKPKRAKRRRA
jgi:hypothetical protein